MSVIGRSSANVATAAVCRRRWGGMCNGANLWVLSVVVPSALLGCLAGDPTVRRVVHGPGRRRRLQRANSLDLNWARDRDLAEWWELEGIEDRALEPARLGLGLVLCLGVVTGNGGGGAVVGGGLLVPWPVLSLAWRCVDSCVGDCSGETETESARLVIRAGCELCDDVGRAFDRAVNDVVVVFVVCVFC